MYLAELLQANIDWNLTYLEAQTYFDPDLYENIGYLLGTLLCNPILFNCLGPEPDLLSERFEKINLRWPESPPPDTYFFDYIT